MRIAYFINTFNSINWGGQATSSGIHYMLEKEYPHAEFVPLKLPDLPFKKIKVLRKFYEKRLINAIMKDDIKQIYSVLEKMRIPLTLFDGFTHVCFNGEGAIHHRSGHMILLMGLLYMAKQQGKYVAAVNQTIDLGGKKTLETLLTKVYNQLDFVSVREPLSYEYTQKIGVEKVHLIPDAVYGLPIMTITQTARLRDVFSLPEKYVAITGSSILKRNQTSLNKVRKIVQYVQDYFHLPIVFMANAKTDIWIAHKLKKEFDLTIIEPPVKYQDAMAIIAGATCLIGGRQHPNIFAFIYKVPYVPFAGNTFKNEGVSKLQHYPLLPLSWESGKDTVENAIASVDGKKELFFAISIPTFAIFG